MREIDEAFDYILKELNIPFTEYKDKEQNNEINYLINTYK